MWLFTRGYLQPSAAIESPVPSKEGHPQVCLEMSMTGYDLT
jgi:hypothetical protein